MTEVEPTGAPEAAVLTPGRALSAATWFTLGPAVLFMAVSFRTNLIGWIMWALPAIGAFLASMVVVVILWFVVPPLRRYPVALGLLAALIVLIPAGLWTLDALTPPTWEENRG